MNYNYQIQTVTYGKTGTEYFPIFSDKSLEILASFMGCEAVAFSKDTIHVIKQALDEPNELYGFSGNIYYMEIIHGIATFGNDIDEEDKRPLVQVEIHDLLTLMEQWLADVKFLRTQMKQLPEKKTLIAAYLKMEYRYTDQKAAKAVDYLMQAREVAVEFIYYIEHGEFIPEKYANNFHGYTAKRLYQETFLSLLGAFNYMAYLKRKPQEALSYLKRGLPHDEIITSEQMQFYTIMNKCIDIFSHATSCDPDCAKRYKKIENQLRNIQKAIRKKSYPRSYSILPLSFYIERHMDTEEMYQAIAELNEWYIKNYQTKSEDDIRRAKIRKYLLDELGLSERRADESIEKISQHKDIYLEFAKYVSTRKFSDNGVTACGYTAEALYEKYPFSPLGAYNYLISLRQKPEQALNQLKKGFRFREIITPEQEEDLKKYMD